MKFQLLTLYFIILQIVFISARNRNNIPNPYPELDRPLVEPLCPQGFKVSIPNIRGMQLFGFHGNVNSAITGHGEGSYAGDITTPSNNGRWEYTTADVQLRNGDIINYWIVAQIGQERYRVENLKHIVKDYEPCEPYNKYRIPSVSPNVEASAAALAVQSAASKQCENNNSDIALIVRQLNTTLMQLNTLNLIVNPLRLQVESLTELLQELIKDSGIGTKLLLVGQVPQTNPVETVRDLLTDRLQLYDLDTKIHQADYTSDGILFEMSSQLDKKRILHRASKLLKKSNYKIVDPECCDYESKSETGEKTTRASRTLLHRID